MNKLEGSADRPKASPALPPLVTDYINLVAKRVGYKRRVRREVRQELIDHFTDALGDVPADQRDQAARQLVEQFGDPKTLAVLIRRGKKRNRPAWEKFLIRSAQAFGLLVVCLVLYAVWLLTGSPGITTDYLAVLNQKARPAIRAGDNAWPRYAKAIELYVDPPILETDPDDPMAHYGRGWYSTERSLASLSPAERAALDEWITKNEPAWREYVAASRQPYNWRPYDTGAPSTAPNDPWDGSLLTVLLPHLASLRNLSKMGIWRARLDMEHGEPRDVVNEALAVARAGAHWQNPNTTVIEQLVGLAISSLEHDEIRRIVASSRLPSADLRDAQAQLGRLYADGYPLMGIELERLSFFDTMQRVFTKGGPGGGHLIPQQAARFLEFAEGPHQYSQPSGRDWLLMGATAIHAGRDATVEMANNHYDALRTRIRMTPYQKHLSRTSEAELFERIPRYRFWLLRSYLPSLERAGELAFRSKAEYEATLTVLALLRYRQETGAYPETLDALVPAYLPTLPMDPYSDGSIRYQPRGDDFVLYSVATDFTDDGGTPAADRTWAENADYLFWPPAPLEQRPPPGTQPAAPPE